MVWGGLNTCISQGVFVFRPLILKHIYINLSLVEQSIPCIFTSVYILFYLSPRKDRFRGKTPSLQTSADFAANSSCTSSDQKRQEIWRHDASSSSRWWLPNLVLSQSKPCLLRVHGRRYTHMCWQDMQPTHPSVVQSSPGSWNVSQPLAGRSSLGQFCRW